VATGPIGARIVGLLIPSAADKFLDAITTKGTEPAFIHCAGGGRATTMWFIKRIAVDHWDAERALSPPLQAIDHISMRK
jgi:protein tyrosine phosphatase (PTP) superfamily phosphohydrolase (DUF442 family)